MLEAAQLQVSKLLKENRDLKLENASLRNEQNRSSTANPKPKLDPELEKVVKDMGRRFALMNQLWVNESDFKTDVPEAFNCRDGNTRYRDAATAKLGIAAELFTEVPTKYHHKMRNSPLFVKAVRFVPLCLALLFAKTTLQFLGAMTQARSNSIQRVRDHEVKIYTDLNLKTKDFQAGDRSTVPEFQALIKNDKGYDVFPPILYRDQIIDPSGLFLNPALIRVRQRVHIENNANLP
jgi:hypothetical protein